MMWRPILAFAAVALVVGGIFSFQIGSLTQGVSQPEKTYITSVDSGNKLLKDPLYAPHKVPVYALFRLGIERVGAYRAISALFACAAVVSCFFILKEWYSNRIAVLGTWLFLTSAWILHVGRLATPEASYLLTMPFLWTAVWLYNTTLRKSAVLLLSLFAAVCVYVPGLVWLIVVAAIWKRKLLWKELRAVPVWFLVICGFGMLIVLLPLVLASISAPRQLLIAAGLPQDIPNIKDLGNNILSIPAYLFARGPQDAVRWLGRLPLLDAFSAVMLIIGMYSLRYHFRLVRIQLLAGSALLLGLLIILGGPVTVTALMPVVYIVIAAGIAFMLQQWFAVFPYNPIARTIATTLISVVVLLVSYYHISHYFIAWPQTPATRQVFRHSLVK